MKKFFLLPIFFFLLISAFFFVNILPPSFPTVTFEVTPSVFVVNQGDGLATIASRLQKHHLIRQQHVFIFYSYLLGLNKSLQAGSFRLSPSLSTRQVIDKLSQGNSHDYWFKIQAGWRSSQIAANLPSDTPFSSSDFLLAVENYQGYLFPDSYLIPLDYDINQLIEVVIKNFNKKFSQAKQNTTTHLDDYQVLILASLLEREAKLLENKKIIAGVLLNRLNIGMGLQVDATVQYARDSQTLPDKYWQVLDKSDLLINSAYNTYKNRGLPPTPICHPGLDSLIAAFHPTDSEYFYYLTGNDGQMHYASSLNTHNLNVAKYLR